MYNLTIFKNIYDNKTHRKMSFESWEEFESLLYSLSKEPGVKPKKGESLINSSPLITSAIFKEGSTRKNDNVIEWSGWCCLDIDNYDCSFNDAIEKFKGVQFLCYSTSSSTKEKPKFRVVIPLTSSVSANKIKHFWYALNTEFSMFGDKQTKDLARIFYVPAAYSNSHQFIFSHKDASILNPFELMTKHPFSDGVKTSGFSPALQAKLIAYKKDKLTANFKWSNYRDCPFVKKSLISEYLLINDNGWYAHIYKIMVSIAANAMKKGYPITPHEIATLCSEIDAENGSWYKNRSMLVEAARAIDFVCVSL